MCPYYDGNYQRCNINQSEGQSPYCMNDEYRSCGNYKLYQVYSPKSESDSGRTWGFRIGLIFGIILGIGEFISDGGFDGTVFSNIILFTLFFCIIGYVIGRIIDFIRHKIE